MSTKQEIIEMIKSMPDNATVDDVMEKLYVRAKIESAIKQIDEGKGIPHDQVKEKFKKWLT
jgi:DNA gyrase/topoisomerase IV subunit B